MNEMSELVDQIAAMAKADSRSMNNGSICWPYTVGYLIGVLKDLPHSKENAEYLKRVVRDVQIYSNDARACGHAQVFGNAPGFDRDPSYSN